MTYFGIASLIAVASGCIVAASAGVGSGTWGRNLVAWAIGALLAILITRLKPGVLLSAIVIVAPAALLISLFSSGMEGVHRWASLGPVRWNVAFVVLPAFLVALAAARTASRSVWLAALVVQAELWLQPDASQATAFAAAAAFLLLRSPFRRLSLATAVTLALGAALTWTRPDPLRPVPEVEGILGLAAAQSLSIAIVCVASLAASALSPLTAGSHGSRDARTASAALCIYFVACTTLPWFGAYPVPLAGMGMSPIIGFWLGIGMLSRVHVVSTA